MAHFVGIDKTSKKVHHFFGVKGQKKVTRGRNVHFYYIRTPSDLFLTFDPKKMIDFFSCLINTYKMSHNRSKSEQVLNFTLCVFILVENRLIYCIRPVTFENFPGMRPIAP